ncbi:MAG TPA: dTMP kinase [Candidatus Paceibacterota bacterium]|nr:dTMP kinase [Candidatus Paceibacterota bacterium]
MRNKLIVFEGIDSSGKATQVALLAKRLRQKGKKVAVFSVPRYGTPVGKLIKAALHGEYGDFRHLDPHLSAIPYLMDYALARESFVAALKKGDVIFDRYVQSTFAYHAAKLSGKKQAAFLRQFEGIAFKEIKLPKPDKVIYLDVPQAISRKLMSTRTRDQHERDNAYQKKVAAVYQKMARGTNWCTIRCAPKGKLLSRREVHELVWKAVHRV